MQIKIAPGIMDADLTRLADSIAELEDGGADLFHLDVMDGHFVPNIMAGPRLTAAVTKCARIPVDVHLMITDPVRYAPAFVEAGADIVLFHAEAVDDLPGTVQAIKELGVQVGVALGPHTPPEAVASVVGQLDCLMAMTVRPGFSGQSFMEDGCRKIPALRQAFGSDIDIYVDGGIGPETAIIAARYGANVMAAASAVFKAGVPPGEAVVRLRDAVLKGLASEDRTS